MHFALIHNHFLFPHKSDFPVYLGFSPPKWLSINIRLIFISLCTLMKVAVFNTLALNVQEEWIYIYIYQYYRDLAMCVLQVISARLANIYYVLNLNLTFTMKLEIHIDIFYMSYFSAVIYICSLGSSSPEVSRKFDWQVSNIQQWWWYERHHPECHKLKDSPQWYVTSFSLKYQEIFLLKTQQWHL